VLRDIRCLGFLVGMLAYSAAYIRYVSVLPLAVHDAGWPAMVHGFMVAINGFTVITCELAVTRKVQHWPRRLGAACGMVLVAAGQHPRPRPGRGATSSAVPDEAMLALLLEDEDEPD
jgi:hypothetical protein